MTLSRPMKAESFGSGSLVTTSSAAPPRWPLSSAAIRASSSMSGPRAVFTITAPFFIRAKAAASMRPRAAGGIHDHRALLHPGEGGGIDEAAGRGRQRRVHRYEIRSRQQAREAHGL